VIKQCVPVIAAVLFAAGCGKQQGDVKAAAKPPEPPLIQVAVAQARAVDRSIFVTGSLQADETVVISSEVSGRVATIRYDFGQFVRKGDIVAELDKQEFQIAVDRASAALAQALARIGLKPGQEEAIPESTPAIRQARAMYEDARSKYESASKLIKTGDISQDRFTEIEKTYLSRKAALEAAEHDLQTQLASIRALRAEVRLAQKRLNDATLRAPMDGAVSVRHVAPGQYIRDNTPVLTLVKAHPLRLRVEIPESHATAVRIGTQLSFTTDAAPGKEFHAVVRELNPALDARARSLAAEARLVERDDRLRPGMFVQVRLVTKANVPIVTVPKPAVYTVAGLAKVFVIRDGKAIECRIPPGLEMDGWVEAPGELVRPGDQVAISHLDKLVNGAPVRVQPAGNQG
jgi:RND family efflux transporter MFP subunit